MRILTTEAFGTGVNTAEEEILIKVKGEFSPEATTGTEALNA
jgi:hypothetical protein